MSSLIDFITTHTQRGACTCGRCCDAGPEPEKHQPTGHTADLIFFQVAARNNPDPEQLKKLLREHQSEYGSCDLLDGKEHSYLQVGGFVGEQGLALMLMGLGSLLGLWKLLTPRSVMGKLIDEEMVHKLAGAGYITIRAEVKPELAAS